MRVKGWWRAHYSNNLSQVNTFVGCTVKDKYFASIIAPGSIGITQPAGPRGASRWLLSIFHCPLTAVYSLASGRYVKKSASEDRSTIAR